MTGTADIVVGLGWGDEGKGATTASLALRHHADRIVRFNGGQQAAHNVILDGVHHTFSTFGSGTLSGVPTWVSGDCTLSPSAFAAEWESLRRRGLLTPTTERIKVHEHALITTPLHVAVNAARERARGEARHGSTGTGFGETVSWDYHGHEALRAGDLADVDRVYELLKAYSDFMGEASRTGEGMVPDSVLHEMTSQIMSDSSHVDVVSDDEFLTEVSSGHTVFEGAQGFLLDENFGQHPHTTWSTTTPANARRIARAAGVDDVTTWGVLRTYATRHGAGPFPHEGDVTVPEVHNREGEFQGAFRTGALDLPLVEWAIEKTLPDVLAITFADVFDHMVTSDGDIDFGDLGVDVGVISGGGDVRDRSWTSAL